MAESKMIKDLVAARRAGVPLLVIETPDPASCIRQVLVNLKDIPLIAWDRATGFKPVAGSTDGEAALQSALGDSDDNGSYPIFDPDKAFRAMEQMPRETICFFINGHWFFDKAENVQAFWNLRDKLKKDKRMAIILSPSAILPEEIKHDVVVLEDPLPNDEELTAVVKRMYKAAQTEEPKDNTVQRAVESCKGLSAFEAEQNVAMSFEKIGSKQALNLNNLWLRKQKTIEMTPGLQIWKGKETFDDVRGVEQLKKFMTMIMNGEDTPTVGVFWDELEKMFAGAKGDLSGVTGEMHGQILSWMADYNVPAMRYIGHAGCSKSYISKAMAGQFKIPLIMMNISELKGSLVGESTKNLKGALKVISAIGRPIVMATCNDEDALSPELRDRFNLGTFFFDLPTEDEQKAVFAVWMSKLKINSPLPSNYKGWTPRNIHDCCTLAWRLKSTLEEASKFIVPVVRSSPERIEALRKKAHKKYLSASYPGVYEMVNQQKEALRSIDFAEVG